MLMLGKNFPSAMTKKVLIHFMTQKRTERCKFENKFYLPVSAPIDVWYSMYGVCIVQRSVQR